MGHALPALASSAPALSDPTPIAPSVDPADALTNGLATTSLSSAPSPVIAATVTDDEEDEEDEATGVEARFFPPLSMQARRPPGLRAQLTHAATDVHPVQAAG